MILLRWKPYYGGTEWGFERMAEAERFILSTCPTAAIRPAEGGVRLVTRDDDADEVIAEITTCRSDTPALSKIS